jgi:GTP-binding protein Era
MMTDQPERQMAAEIIREKLLRTLDKEVPHGVAVVIEEFKDEKSLIRIRAEIFCEKASHKGIIVGKGGAELKRVGTYAREDLEKLFGTKVFLDLWVKVKENWRESRAAVGNFGYREEK